LVIITFFRRVRRTDLTRRLSNSLTFPDTSDVRPAPSSSPPPREQPDCVVTYRSVLLASRTGKAWAYAGRSNDQRLWMALGLVT
jgi:hypothetical protein